MNSSFAFGFGFSASSFFYIDISCWKVKFSSSVCKILLKCSLNYGGPMCVRLHVLIF